MRTTVTLDDDVAAQLEKALKDERLGFAQVRTLNPLAAGRGS